MFALRNRPLPPRLTLLLVASLIVLEGCGFRLRGSTGGELALPPLYIQSSGSNLFASALRQALGNTKTRVVDLRSAAALIVAVGAERLERRVLTVDANGRVQEYELYYAVSLAVNDASARPVLGEQTISQRRSFEFTGADVLAKEAEEQLLYQELRRSAVQSAMRRLQALMEPATQEGDVGSGVVEAAP